MQWSIQQTDGLSREEAVDFMQTSARRGLVQNAESCMTNMNRTTEAEKRKTEQDQDANFLCIRLKIG